MRNSICLSIDDHKDWRRHEESRLGSIHLYSRLLDCGFKASNRDTESKATWATQVRLSYKESESKQKLDRMKNALQHWLGFRYCYYAIRQRAKPITELLVTTLLPQCPFHQAMHQETSITYQL